LLRLFGIVAGGCFGGPVGVPRDIDSHRKLASEWRALPNENQRHIHELEWGVRFSVLLELPYFDPIDMVIIGKLKYRFLGYCAVKI
jgi:hypothetical protein